MPSRFPGMDPYLESPTLFPDVHHGLISHIQKALNPALRPPYVARVELRLHFRRRRPRPRGARSRRACSEAQTQRCARPHELHGQAPGDSGIRGPLGRDRPPSRRGSVGHQPSLGSERLPHPGVARRSPIHGSLLARDCPPAAPRDRYSSARSGCRRDRSTWGAC